MAKLAARPRGMGPYPGWHCGIDYYGNALGPRFRTAIWKYCNERDLESPVRMRFHAGLRVYTYIGNDLSKCLFVGGCYEPNEFAFLDEILQPGMSFVDVGANEGLYTVFAAAKVGMGGRVLALEPSRREYARLTDNVRLNELRNVKALRIAASDFNGKARLRVAGYEHEGHNTLGELGQEVEFSREEEVQARRLDDVLAEEGVEKVDVVKIDVEGAEEAVIRGMAETLARHRPMMLMEVFDRALRAQGSSAKSLIDLLRSRGYRIFVFSDQDGRPVPLQRAPRESENVLALTEDRMERYGFQAGIEGKHE